MLVRFVIMSRILDSFLRRSGSLYCSRRRGDTIWVEMVRIAAEMREKRRQTLVELKAQGRARRSKKKIVESRRSRWGRIAGYKYDIGKLLHSSSEFTNGRKSNIKKTSAVGPCVTSLSLLSSLVCAAVCVTSCVFLITFFFFLVAFLLFFFSPFVGGLTTYLG